MNDATLLRRWRRPLSAAHLRQVARELAGHTVVITPTHVEVHIAARCIAAEEVFGGSPSAWWVATTDPRHRDDPPGDVDRRESDACG